MTHYYQDITNLRHALKVVASKIPEVLEIAQRKSIEEKDIDLSMAAMTDAEFMFMQEKYGYFSKQIYEFDPNDEYGAVKTMWPNEMNGE
jgi:hypothetical protein